MIACRWKPCASSARRIAPMRPSIMSDGPRMSAPASACTSAMLLQRRSVSSFRTTPSRDQPVVAVGVVGVERHVEHDPDLRHRRLDRAGGAADEVLRVPGLGRLRVLVGRLGEGEERDAGDAERRRLLGRPHRPVDRQPRRRPAATATGSSTSLARRARRSARSGRRARAGSRRPWRGSRAVRRSRRGRPCGKGAVGVAWPVLGSGPGLPIDTRASARSSARSRCPRRAG